mgnify:CR=1 FL=1
MPGVVTQDAHAEHPALDIACAVGTPVRAAHDGVASVVRSHTHGNTVVLVGNNGLETSYSHLHSTEAPGTYQRGDVIGLCGNTGACSCAESSGPRRVALLAAERRRVPCCLIPPG